MPNAREETIVEQLSGQEFCSNGEKRRMEELVRRSGDQVFPVIVFEDDTAMSLDAFELLSNPWHYAQNCGGVHMKTLLSYDGFTDVIGEEPEIPRHLATPDQVADLVEG